MTEPAKKREMHLLLEPTHDTKLRQITHKLWSDQKRSGVPKDSEGARHAIDVAHGVMFP